MTQQPQGNASIGNVPTVTSYPADATIDTTIKTEHPDDRAARIKREEADANSKRTREEVKEYSFGTLYVLSFLISGAVSLWGPDAATKQGAFTIFSAILGALGGYLVGGKKEK